MNEKKDNSPEKSELRVFGLAVGLVFLVIGLWPVRHELPVRTWSVAVSLMLILPALIAPLSLEIPWKIWMRIGGLLGWINTRLILTLLYFFAILPVAIILRLTGKTPLKLKIERNSETYRETPEDHDLFDPRQQY